MLELAFVAALGAICADTPPNRKPVALDPELDDSQMWQNIFADEEGLVRMTEAEFRMAVREKKLVPLPKHRSLEIDPRLDKPYRYLLPRATTFLTELAAEFGKTFRGRRLRVTSAIRPIERQKRLQQWNPSAASTEGEKASTHSTGATLDITKKNLRSKERVWLARELLKLECRGLAETLEERGAFHVMVLRAYGAVEDAEKSERKEGEK